MLCMMTCSQFHYLAVLGMCSACTKGNACLQAGDPNSARAGEVVRELRQLSAVAVSDMAVQALCVYPAHGPEAAGLLRSYP